MKTSKLLLFFIILTLCITSFAQNNVKIGDIYTFEDNTKGIVFYVDDNGHGLAVSLTQEKVRWENESNFVYCQDIINIPNEEYPYTELNYGLGKYYTSYIIEQLGENRAPAAKYSRENGIDWYLPSAGELNQLINNANKHGDINRILVTNGYTPLKGSYWTSSESNNGEAWRIKLNGKIKKCSKLATRIHARAIRMF